MRAQAFIKRIVPLKDITIRKVDEPDVVCPNAGKWEENSSY